MSLNPRGKSLSHRAYEILCLTKRIFVKSPEKQYELRDFERVIYRSFDMVQLIARNAKKKCIHIFW